jgi:hypothetical protein
VGTARNYYWRFKNNTESTMMVNFNEGAPLLPSYMVKWFKGQEDITAEATGAGFVFNLAAGKAKDFRSKVKVLSGPSPQCLTANANAGVAAVTSVRINGSPCD